MNKLGQEPAFPEDYINQDGTHQTLPGMSKRFYAACAAMKGIVTSDFYKNFHEYYEDSEEIVKAAYHLADELLKQEDK